MSVKVDRALVEDARQENRLPDFGYGLKVALNEGVKTGRIERDVASILRGIIYKPRRRSVAPNSQSRDVLEELRQWTVKRFLAHSVLLAKDSEEHEAEFREQLKLPTFPWFKQKDWLCEHLAAIKIEAFKLMVRFPIEDN